MGNKTYNGWRNIQTWKVSMFCNTDIYEFLKEGKNRIKTGEEAKVLIVEYLINSGYPCRSAPSPVVDGTWLGDSNICWPEIKSLINELRGLPSGKKKKSS